MKRSDRIDLPRRHNARVQRDRQQERPTTFEIPDNARHATEKDKALYEEGYPSYYTTGSEEQSNSVQETPTDAYAFDSDDENDTAKGITTEFLSIGIDEDMKGSQVYFYGRAAELNEVICYAEIKFLTDDDFSDDKQKQAAFFASLFRGSALTWLAQERKTNPALLSSYPELITKTKQAFGHNEASERQQAARRLTQARQRTTVQHFHIQLERDATLLKWDETAKQTTFIRGLKTKTREAIITKGEKYATLSDLANEAQRIDDEVFTSNRPRYGGRQQGSRQGGGGFKGKCNSCGRFGHKAASCKGGTSTPRW